MYEKGELKKNQGCPNYFLSKHGVYLHNSVKCTHLHIMLNVTIKILITATLNGLLFEYLSPLVIGVEVQLNFMEDIFI
jgi:hypothetical protein